jgi:hypothetical protein
MATKNMKEESAPLLQRIPASKLTAKQRRLRPCLHGNPLPLYECVREPTHYDEIMEDVAIWRSNGTVISIGSTFYQESSPRGVIFALYEEYEEEDDDGKKNDEGDNPDEVDDDSEEKEDDEDDDDSKEEDNSDHSSNEDDDEDGELHLHGGIFGETEASIAETATFFWSLKHRSATNLAVLKLVGTRRFDVKSFQPRQLTRIVESNPHRHWDLQAGEWIAQQSVVLATLPVNLRLGGSFSLPDDGTAFVDAFQQRTTPMQSMILDFDNEDMPFSKANLTRLLQLENMGDRLRINTLEEKEMMLLPFSAKVNCLEYELMARKVNPEDFNSIEFGAKSLYLTLYLDWVEDGNWYGHVVSLFNRVAQLGHLESLSLFLQYSDWMSRHYSDSDDEISSIADALIRLIQGNPNLRHLNVGDILWCVDDEPHLPRIFKALEDHPCLRTVIIEGCKKESKDDGVKYSSHLDYDALWLLLSRNRNIAVLDFSGKRISDGARIDKVYELTRYYKLSLKLVTKCTSLRPKLVTSALFKSASGKFPHTAVLLAHHLDVLCELVAGIDLDSIVIQSHADRPKRRARRGRPPASKRAARR